MPNTFEKWLGQILGQDAYSVSCLIKDPIGLHFLIAWSLFESKCCAGNFNAGKHCVSAKMPETGPEENDFLMGQARHFHHRYKLDEHLGSLAPVEVTNRNARKEFVDNLSTPETTLSCEQARMMVVFVAHRVRNNMFHGQKGIDDWFRDRDLIGRCTKVLQVFVTAKERESPTLAIAS
jgi:hypothetical protein